jgi:hypothetical protein
MRLKIALLIVLVLFLAVIIGISIIPPIVVNNNFLGNRIDMKIRLWELCSASPSRYRTFHEWWFGRQAGPILPGIGESVVHEHPVLTWAESINHLYKFIWNKGLPHMNNYKAFIRQELEETIGSSVASTTEPKQRQKQTVIHLRLADVPFLRHKHYHVYRFRLYKQIIQEIERDRQTKQTITILATTKCAVFEHEREQVSRKIVNSLVTYLKRRFPSIEIHVRFNTPLSEDLKIMMECDYLIGFAGSLVYYAGIAGRGHFYSSQPSVDSKHMTQVDAKSFRIEHESVKNYYDASALIVRLEE